MEYPLLIILLAMLQYLAFSFRTGTSRPKYGVLPPKMTGNETWERISRVHQNTLEQIVVFIPALLLFSYYVSPRWALLPGVAYLVARQVYSHQYINNPPKRLFPPTFLVNVILVLGGIIGIIISLVKAA